MALIDSIVPKQHSTLLTESLFYILLIDELMLFQFINNTTKQHYNCYFMIGKSSSKSQQDNRISQSSESGPTIRDRQEESEKQLRLHNFIFKSDNVVSDKQIIRQKQRIESKKSDANQSLKKMNADLLGFAFEYECCNLFKPLCQNYQIAKNASFEVPLNDFKQQIGQIKKLFSQYIANNQPQIDFQQGTIKSVDGLQQMIQIIQPFYFQRQQENWGQNTKSDNKKRKKQVEKNIRGDIDFFVMTKAKYSEFHQKLKADCLKQNNHSWIIQNFCDGKIQKNREYRIICQMKKHLNPSGFQDKKIQNAIKSLKNQELKKKLSQPGNKALIGNLCQILKNILAVRTFDYFNSMNFKTYLRSPKGSLIKSQRSDVVMYLIVNNKMDSQNFRKILKPFRQTIKFWLEKLDATLNIIGFNPEIDNFAIQEQRLNKKMDQQIQKQKMLNDQFLKQIQQRDEQRKRIDEQRLRKEEQRKIQDERIKEQYEKRIKDLEDKFNSLKEMFLKQVKSNQQGKNM